MDEKETREIDRFDAVSEDGRVFTITVYQDFLISHSHNGTSSQIPGLKKAITAEGYHANYKDNNTFQIVELNLTITKINT